MPRPLHVAHRIAPEGIPEDVLLGIACIVSGFAQELIFRGYLIPRFERLVRSTLIAVLVTTAMFASFHVYQGTVSMIGVAAVGFVYAIAFCLLRRLWPVCAAHAISLIVFYCHLTR
jgi:membrane protease YdiL (CAAX protease family)